MKKILNILLAVVIAATVYVYVSSNDDNSNETAIKSDNYAVRIVVKPRTEPN